MSGFLTDAAGWPSPPVMIIQHQDVAAVRCVNTLTKWKVSSLNQTVDRCENEMQASLVHAGIVNCCHESRLPKCFMSRHESCSMNQAN